MSSALALCASSLQVAQLRERKEWDSLLATGRRGRAIMLDLNGFVDTVDFLILLGNWST